MIILIIFLIISILIHEAGHLIASKICKCPVLVYSVGFGKPVLFKKTIGKTQYQLTPWLLGGFVSLYKETEYSRSKYAFSNLKYSRKIFILLAGILVNLLAGLISCLIALKVFNYNLMLFGLLNITLGITNLIPFATCIDGGYAVYFPHFVKKYGQKRGVERFAKNSKFSFKIIMYINILTIVGYIIYLIIK
jgi:membrane-associated protease RseP (regulator of RpoE activity)